MPSPLLIRYPGSKLEGENMMVPADHVFFPYFFLSETPGRPPREFPERRRGSQRATSCPHNHPWRHRPEAAANDSPHPANTKRRTPRAWLEHRSMHNILVHRQARQSLWLLDRSVVGTHPNIRYAQHLQGPIASSLLRTCPIIPPLPISAVRRSC